jgi:hypothetical protein
MVYPIESEPGYGTTFIAGSRETYANMTAQPRVARSIRRWLRGDLDQETAQTDTHSLSFTGFLVSWWTRSCNLSEMNILGNVIYI